jgi:hypothetical protein
MGVQHPPSPAWANFSIATLCVLCDEDHLKRDNILYTDMLNKGPLLLESKGTLQGSAHTVCAHVKQDFIVNLIVLSLFLPRIFICIFILAKMQISAAFPNLWITYTQFVIQTHLSIS